MDHTAAQVSGRCCHGAGVCVWAGALRGRGRTAGTSDHTVILVILRLVPGPARSQSPTFTSGL